MLKRSKSNDSYLTDLEIATLLGITVARLRNKLSAGQPLPPYIQLPGCRKRLWPCGGVNDWLTGFTIDGREGHRDGGNKVPRQRANRRSSRTLIRL